jgi:hypothetical protein
MRHQAAAPRPALTPQTLRPGAHSLDADSPGLAGFSLPNLPMHSLGHPDYIRHPKTGPFVCTNVRVPQTSDTTVRRLLRRRRPSIRSIDDGLFRLPQFGTRPHRPDFGHDLASRRPCPTSAWPASHLQILNSPARASIFALSNLHLLNFRPSGRASHFWARRPGSTYQLTSDDGRAALPPSAGHVFRHLCPHKLCHPSPHTFLSIFLLLLFLTLTTASPPIFLPFSTASFLPPPPQIFLPALPKHRHSD